MIGGEVLDERLRPWFRQTVAAYPSIYKQIAVLKLLAEREVMSGPSISLPLRRRLSLWRHGFTSRSGVLFDIDEWKYDDYMSDYLLERLDELGGPWSDVARNKLASHLLLHSFDDHLPTLYGVLDDGELRRESTPMVVSSDISGLSERTEAFTWIEEYLDEHDVVVLKPVYGNSGTGVLVCRRQSGRDHGYVINGEYKIWSEFASLVDGLNEYLVTEFVDQADYATDLFSESTNTLRILTLWDEEADEPFVSGAVHRIGTADSAPVDNWSRGGLSADIRPDGTLSSGAQWDSTRNELRWHDIHPDTGGRIEGVRVPKWPAVRDQVVKMAAELPYLPRLGWDIAITDDGEFVVLEINTHAGIETVQVHRPHLRDQRTRRFYERHGYV